MVLAVSYALNAQSQYQIQGSRSGASPSQKRLAEITEMIHTASLFHDDVIDKVNSRHLSVNCITLRSILASLYLTYATLCRRTDTFR